jgi:hypothetical protein
MAGLAGLRAGFWARRSREERLLFACARQGFGAASRREAEQALDGGDLAWDTVVQVARKHQVAPLVHWNLERGELLGRVPPGAAQTLAALRQENVAQKQRLARALVEAIAWFRARGLDTLLMKGTSLDRRVYDQDWFTSSQDADLLLGRPGDELTKEVWQRMVALNVGDPILDAHFGKHPDLAMNGLLRVDFAALWQDAEPILVGGERAFLATVENELLSACINGCRKRYFKLKSPCEIAAILERFPRLDWDAVTARARAWDCHRMVYASLVATHLATGIDLPEGLRERCAVTRPRAALLHHLLERLSYSSLPRLFSPRQFRGKSLCAALLLPYASNGIAQLPRGLAIVLRQMLRGGYA